MESNINIAPVPSLATERGHPTDTRDGGSYQYQYQNEDITLIWHREGSSYQSPATDTLLPSSSPQWGFHLHIQYKDTKYSTDFFFFPPDLTIHLQRLKAYIYLTIQSFHCNRSLISGFHFHIQYKDTEAPADVVQLIVTWDLSPNTAINFFCNPWLNQTFL